MGREVNHHYGWGGLFIVKKRHIVWSILRGSRARTRVESKKHVRLVYLKRFQGESGGFQREDLKKDSIL